MNKKIVVLTDKAVYYSYAEALSLTFEVDESATETYYFKYYYSADSMFSDKELSAAVYSGSADVVYEDGQYYYHFDLPSDYIEAGYYIIAVDTESGNTGNRAALAVCQVID